ncbi:MAG TPA: hypothetical protein PLJ08_22230 [Cyclobacteriaceae bacterium]|nr:hypothetical protein [Cyclobacteriaceae bacterium]
MKLLKVVVLVLVVISGYSQTKTPIVATDLMKIATTNQIQISPDGTKAVLVVNRKGVKNENEYYYTRNLYLLDLVTKTEPLQLTFGDKNDLSPQWSPDGTYRWRQIAIVVITIKWWRSSCNNKSRIWCEQSTMEPRWKKDFVFGQYSVF